ncbi:MAG: Tetratricopeptide domain protein [Planctomycetaceae bacterium]|nr:Tetratricopeptide domain protein [Planctomycetaceae bacterium]
MSDGMGDDRKSQIAKDCFKRGTEAMMKQNWEYSCQMFRTAVDLVPDNQLYRASLRGVTEKRYNNNQSGAAMAGMKLMTTKATIKKCRMQSDWKSIAKMCEDGLAINPWDAQLNADLGEALTHIGYTDPAVYSYERAVKGEPNNKDYLRALGKLYEARRNFDPAIEVYTKLYRLDPLDGEARSKIMSLTAEKAVDKGGYDGDDVSKVQKHMSEKMNKDTADGPGMSVQADLERACRKDPGSKDNWLKLADFLRREGNLEKTVEALEKALEVSGGEVKIREQLEDAQLEIMRKAVGFAKEEYATDSENKFTERKYKEAKRELMLREIEIFASRIEHYPQNMALKFDLALLYMQDKRHQLAIPLLQKSRGDARRKVESLINLGKCFIADKQYPLSRRQFEAAVPECKSDDNLDIFLDLHYMLGRVCEELKDKDAAIRHYQTVLEYDYDYKDNRERLARLEGGGEPE